MKKFTALLLILCLLLTTGCAGRNSGAVSKKPLEIKKLSTEPAATLYTAERLAFPLDVWFCQGCIVSIEDKPYLLGELLDGAYLFRMNADGSEAVLLASCGDGSERWANYCAMGGALYIYDSMNNQLIEFSPDGARLRNIALPDDLAVYGLAAGSSTIYALGEETINALKIGDGDKAELDYTIKCPSARRICQDANGKVYVAWYDGETQAISVLDEENKCRGETRYFDSACGLIGSGSQWELYLLIGHAIYGYNFSNESIQKILTLTDVGLLSNGTVYESPGGSLIYTGTSKQEPSSPMLLTPAGEAGESTKLTLATLGMLHPSITDAVLAWNQLHPECPIEIKDYSVYSTGGDPRSAELQLAADIASGNGPDLYNLSDFDTTLNASLLARRNLLENLYPYIDKDQELSREDFFSGPLSAAEMNGSLFQITPYFLLLTALAAAQDVGAPENWTYEQLERVVEDSDYYQYLFDAKNNRNDWLELMMTASGKKLVDWSSAQCSFDSEYFIHLLELAKARPEETDIMGGTASDLIHDSHALLFTVTVRTVSDAGIAPDAYGEGNYAFVGLPEIGNVLVPELSLGMSVQSAHKDLCWEFLREFLLKDSAYAKAGIPLRRDGARQQLNNELEAMKKYPVDHPGREQAMEELLDVIENTTVLYQTDAQLWSIIEDETAKFYAGQNTAEETARAIQSRASIYLAEQQ